MAAVLAACAAPGMSRGATGATGVAHCTERIIVTFLQPQGHAPDPALVAHMARDARAQLTFLRTAGPGLYVFRLSAPGSGAGCRGALARLRHDPRIRSVDVDRRRRAGH